MKQIFRVILAGMLGGVALFILPFFVIRIVAFFFLISLIFRLVRPHRSRRAFSFCHNPANRPDWKNMTKEERELFKEKMKNDFFSQEKSPSPNL